MKHILTITATAIILTLGGLMLQAEESAPPEDAPSLIEQGARMFLKGLMQEANPAMEEMRALAEQLGPKLREFANVMGPALADILENVDDLSAYEAPELLPNGDIIIRRKPQKDTPPEQHLDPGEEIEI